MVVMRHCILIGIVFALQGCSRRIMDFTMISTRNIEMSGFSEPQRRVKGTSCVPVIFGPLGVPNMEDAIEDAIDEVPGADALVDGVLTQQNNSFLFGSYCYVIEGSPISTRPQAP